VPLLLWRSKRPPVCKYPRQAIRAEKRPPGLAYSSALFSSDISSVPMSSNRRRWLVSGMVIHKAESCNFRAIEFLRDLPVASIDLDLRFQAMKNKKWNEQAIGRHQPEGR